MLKLDFTSAKTAKIEKYQLRKFKLAMTLELEWWSI